MSARIAIGLVLAASALACHAADRADDPLGRRPAVAAQQPDPELDALEARVRADAANHPLADDYRKAAVAHHAQRRSIAFFESLADDAATKAVPNVHYQLAMALIDAVPAVMPIARGSMASRAIVSFEHTIALDPTHWDAYYGKGLLFLNMPEAYRPPGRSIEEFRHLLELQRGWAPRPEFALTYVRLGDAYDQEGDQRQAVTVWTEGARQFPGNLPLRGRLKGERQHASQ